jgi:CheY-like chemotaxis protein
MDWLIAQNQLGEIGMETGYTVFVVDDDKTTRLLLSSMLASKYLVEAFDSAESCLERLAQK